MNKQLISFLIVRFLSSVGDQLLLFAVPLLVYKATNSIAMSGLAFFIEWMPRIISLPFAGVFSDRFGGRKVYLIADSSRAIICTIGFCLITAFPHYIFYFVSILMALSAIFYAQAFIAQESTIPTLVPQEDLHKAQSMVQTIEQTAMIVGPLLGSLFSTFLPISDLLVIIAISFSASFVGMFLLKGFYRNNTFSKASKSNILQNMYEGLLILGKSKKLIWLCVNTILVNLIWGLILATSAAFVTGTFNKSTAIFGYLQTTSGIVSIFALLITPRIINSTSIRIVGMISFGLIIMGAFLVGSNSSFLTFILGYLIILSMDGVFNIYIRTERAKIIPKEHMGKTIGLIVFVNQLSVPISGLLVAKYSAIIGADKLFIVMGFIVSSLFVFQLIELFLPLYLRVFSRQESS